MTLQDFKMSPIQVFLDLRKKSQESNFETSQVGTIKIFKWVIQNNMEKTPLEINLLTALCFY